MSRTQEAAEGDVLDEATIEALFAGVVDPAVDPSSATARLARLLAEMRTVDRREPVGGEVEMRVLYRREFQGSAASSAPAPIPLYGARSTHRVGRRAAALGAVLALGASGVAAASGILPAAVQHRAHDALAMVGISVPDGRPGADRPSGPGSNDDQGSPSATVMSTVGAGNQGSGDAGAPANRTSTGDASGAHDGNGGHSGHPADPNAGSPADPNPGSPADPNPGGPANPNVAGSANPDPGQPGNPNAGQPANPDVGGPGSTGRPADPNAGGFANSGGVANPTPGGSANPNAGGRGQPAESANPNSGRPANPGK